MIHFEKILILKPDNFEFTMTLQNVPDLFINGCSFKNIHPDSELSEDKKVLMKQYGAVFN